MGVPATSEWELETWNYLLVYPPASNLTPCHMVMYHYHRYTDYTPAFSGNDEHLLFATPLNGNDAASRNPYTEWANMHAVVGMAPSWTNRWRSPTLNYGVQYDLADRERGHTPLITKATPLETISRKTRIDDGSRNTQK